PCEDTASVATRSHLGSREQALPDTESASTLILVQPSELSVVLGELSYRVISRPIVWTGTKACQIPCA
ncbi:hypothetical protein CK820_G0053434, partial [Pan troglodytes]